MADKDSTRRAALDRVAQRVAKESGISHEQARKRVLPSFRRAAAKADKKGK